MKRPSLNLLAAVAAGLVFLPACQDGSPPCASRGRLDLAGHDPGAAPVRLDGEWELHWDRLLTPEDFQAGQVGPPAAFLRLPSTWKGVEVDGAHLPGTGKATFRLRLDLGPGERRLALRLFDVASAWRLWADGVLLGECGKVGTNPETEVADWSTRVVGLPSTSGPVELVLQVSNFHEREGGIVSSIELGDEARLRAEQARQWALSHLAVGILLAMGLYHLALYAFRRRDVAPLAFGLYCLLWMGNHSATNSSGWAVRAWLPGLPSLGLEAFALGCFVTSVPVGFWFFRCLYPEEFSRRLLHAASLVAAAAALGLAVLPVWSVRFSVPLYYAWTALLIVCCLRGLVRAFRLGRTGAGFILVGFVILGAAAVNDMLYDLQLIQSVFLIPAGLVSYAVFQALALAQRSSRSFADVERLSQQLEVTNRAQQQEMAERARLENEIVRISEEERRRVSHDLHDGLCQLLTAARLQCSVLQASLSEARVAPEALGAISSLLDRAVGDAYDLSRGLWPADQDAQTASGFLTALAQRLSGSSGVAIDFRQELGCADCACDGLTQLSRIGQEAVTNAVRHAKARRVEISLECVHGLDQVRLSVRDDGVGRGAAAPSGGGLGLRIMEHRAKLIGGSFSMADAEGGGTVVVCVAPCGRKSAG